MDCSFEVLPFSILVYAIYTKDSTRVRLNINLETLHIPNDIKVISFSNLQPAAFLNPSLTTITQPAFEIGREAASILFKLIEKKGHNFLLEKAVLKSKLIERNSTKRNEG